MSSLPSPSHAGQSYRTIFGCISAALLLLTCQAAAAPFRPVDGATILYVAPRSAAPWKTNLHDLLAKLADDPADLSSALEVARLAIRDGRANADPRRYGQAQAALGRWWSDPGAPLQARVLRAVIRQALHDFAGARADLDAILTADPGNGQARLTRAFVLQTIGALDQAKADCRALPRSVGPTVAMVCSARMAALTGSAPEALERLTQVIGSDRRSEPGLRRFAQGVAAEIAAALGRESEADRLFAAAAEGDADIPSLVAYADFLLDTGRPAEALALLSGRSEADLVLLRLAIAGKAVGDPRAARWAALLAERFAIGRTAGSQRHLREEARFELELNGNPRKALALARENWAIEKEPPDARLVLQAALAAEAPEAAADVLGFLETTGLADVRLKDDRNEIAARPENASAPVLARDLERH